MTPTVSPRTNVSQSAGHPIGASHPGGTSQPGHANRPAPSSQPAPPSQPAEPKPGTVAGRLHEARAWALRRMSGTPGRMRILALLAIAVSLVFAVTAFSSFRSIDDALRQGGDNARQLVRIQAIHTNLVRADADATNAFLVGGLEPADQRADFTSSLAQASKLIAEAANAQPADGEALGALNSSVVTYASLIEQARATNRQALPVGAQYVRLASSGLRSDALPILDALVRANDARVSAEFDSATRVAPLVTAGLLALLVLIGGMVWLSLRTHRYLNPPLAAATAAILVTLLVGSISLAVVASWVEEVRDGSYAATLATATARTAAFDAKSNESLTLIARGSGSAFEDAWVSSSEVVGVQSKTPALLNSDAKTLGGLWAGYVDTHKQIREADSSGKWENAVKQATGSGDKTANAAFDAFDVRSGTALASSSLAVSESLDAPRAWLPFAAWLALLVGLAAAVSAWWGVSLRLEEYR